MTRYQVNHPCLYVLVGYDDTIHSLFALVKDMDVPDDCHRSHEETLLEIGGTEGEIPDVEALVEALNPYLDVPETVANELRQDMRGVGQFERLTIAARSMAKRVASLFF